MGNREAIDEHQGSRARGDAQESHAQGRFPRESWGYQKASHWNSRKELMSTLPQPLQVIIWRAGS